MTGWHLERVSFQEELSLWALSGLGTGGLYQPCLLFILAQEEGRSAHTVQVLEHSASGHREEVARWPVGAGAGREWGKRGRQEGSKFLMVHLL